VEQFLNLVPYIKNPLVQKGLGTLAVILMLWLIRWLLLRIAERNIEDAKTLFSTKKTVGYVVAIIGTLVIGRIWLRAFDSFATYFGLLSAGIAIALKDMLANLVGWLFIIWRRPFTIGNRIQIGTHSGDVIDIRPFQFTILEIGNWVKADQSTGRIIHIPNGQIFTMSLSNYDQGFQYIWNEIPVLITFESNWQKAKGILQKILDDRYIASSKKAEAAILEAAKKYLIFYRSITPKVYTSVEDSGVLLSIRYLTEIRKRRGSSEEIWEAVLTAFGNESDIDLAYPTYRRVE